MLSFWRTVAVREYLQKYFFDVYDWYGDNLVENVLKSSPNMNIVQ